MGISEIHWSVQSAYPVLAALQVLPLFAVLLLYGMRESNRLYLVATTFAIAELLLAVDLYRIFDHARPAMQLAEQLALLPILNYHAAADGMTVLFMLLTGLLTLLVVLYSRARRIIKPHRFLVITFTVQAALQSLFATLDMLWFAFDQRCRR